MLSLNLSSREQLGALGLSAADVNAFVELRTEFGELLPDRLNDGGFSADGIEILRRAIERDNETDRRLPRLELTLRPNPPLATMEQMVMTITHHGAIDAELRIFKVSFLPHGPVHLRVFDVSHAHIVKFEVRTPAGELVFERAAIPQIDAEPERPEGALDEDVWHLIPPLRSGESWRPDAEAIFARLRIDTHVRPEIEAIEPDPRADVIRSGRFIVPGQPHVRFDDFSFAFGFPGDELFASLPSLFGGGDAPTVARLHPSDPLISRIPEFVGLEPGEVDFDGMFAFEAIDRPDLNAKGWAWVLTGAEVFVGFQPDPALLEPRPEVLIPLPGSELTSQDDVPYNITERGMLERPELFGGDPGINCRPFDQPGRILGERRFETALRVTQPLVADARIDTITFKDITRRPIDYPRESTSDQNPVEYEGEDTALYQAKSVAIGHLLETAVRYRSNGYSLGDIAYSLTLAPRQKRRIVKIEFSRSERVRRREATRTSDEVADALDSSRSYDNAVSASLDEWAKGRSSSSVTSAAAGAGFAVPGFVAGGGVATSTAKSASSQSGGRRTAANETQQINDAIRRYGESLRTLQSTVVHEVEQEESVEGVSEVIQNINYTRSLSVIYYEILRHLRVDTEVAGVTECVFVPMPVREFTDQRIKRHKDVLARYARSRWERLAFQNLEFLPNDLDNSDIPGGKRANQTLTTLSGSLYIKLGLEMPGEGEIAAEIDAATDETVTDERIANIYRRNFGFFTPYLPEPISRIVSRTVSASPAERNRYFQREIAPHMARRYMDDLLLLDEDGTDLEADFTLATDYSYGRTVRVDFTVDASGRNVTRADTAKMRVMFDDRFRIFDAGADNPNRFLPPRSFMDVTRGVINYGNDLYDDRAWSDRGTRDLVNSINGHAEDDGALLTFKLSHADTRDLHKLIEGGYSDFKERLATRPFYYHKAIWWRMDRDELYTLLDGYSFDEAEGRSLASIVARRPLGILGNSLVFKVTTEAPLDPMFASFADLKNHYVSGLPPRDPIRISLPTDGLYARAHMDGCIAAEEHNGSFDWVFDNQEPELADLPSSLLESRRSHPADATPTAFPDTIINLQNAPDMPAPSGLQGALGAVQNAGAFRDMAGLAGTQANARAGLETAAGLATSFGGMAFQGAMAQLQSDANAASDLKGMFSAIEKARDNGLITPQQAEQAAMDAIGRRMGGKDTVEDQHRREIEKKAMDGEGGGSVTRTNKDGVETVTKGASPQPGESGIDGLEGAFAQTGGRTPGQIDPVTAAIMRPLLLDAIDTFRADSITKVGDRVAAIIDAGNAELEFWSVNPDNPTGPHLAEDTGRPGSGHARQAEILARLRSYIDSARPDLPERTRQTHAEDYTLPDANPDRKPWSASFISHLHREAGWSEAEGFAFYNGHHKYVRQALCNRLNRDYSKPFWLFRADEVEIETGDLIGGPRSWFTNGFDFNLSFFGVPEGRPRMVWQNGEWRVGTGSFPSHNDVVVSFEDRTSADPVEAAMNLQSAMAVGGNTSHIGTPNANTCGLKRFNVRNGVLERDPNLFVVKLLRERHFDEWRALSRAHLGEEGDAEEAALLFEATQRNSLLDVFGTENADGERALPNDLVRHFDRERGVILPDEGSTPIEDIDFNAEVRPVMKLIPPDLA